MDSEDRSEWDRVWGGRIVRRLPAHVRLEREHLGSLDLGDPTHVDIAADPIRFADKVLRLTDNCPVCGSATAPGERVAVSLYPHFSKGISFGTGAWAHEPCLSTCEILPGVRHVPW